MVTRFSKALVPYEADEQRAYFEWVDINAETDWRYSLIFHCPNGAHLANGAKTFFFLQRIGLRKGFPDIGILLPSRLGHGLFIEMKRKGQGLQKEQEMWKNKLHAAGYAWALCRTCEEARIATLDWFSYLPDRLKGAQPWTKFQSLFESTNSEGQKTE